MVRSDARYRYLEFMSCILLRTPEGCARARGVSSVVCARARCLSFVREDKSPVKTTLL